MRLMAPLATIVLLVGCAASPAEPAPTVSVTVTETAQPSATPTVTVTATETPEVIRPVTSQAELRQCVRLKYPFELYLVQSLAGRTGKKSTAKERSEAQAQATINCRLNGF